MFTFVSTDSIAEHRGTRWWAEIIRNSWHRPSNSFGGALAGPRGGAQAAAADTGPAVILAVRLKVDKGKVSEIETIVNRQGELFFIPLASSKRRIMIGRYSSARTAQHARIHE